MQEIIKCTSISYVVIIPWLMFQNGKVYLVLDITTCTSIKSFLGDQLKKKSKQKAKTVNDNHKSQGKQLKVAFWRLVLI